MCYDTSRVMHQGEKSQTRQHTMPLCPQGSHRTIKVKEVSKIGYQYFKENQMETHYGLGLVFWGMRIYTKTCEK